MTMLSATSNLSVKDGLILNIDSTIFDSNISSTEILNNSEKYFGKNVELYNIDYNFVGDYTFNFDGIDDFITVKPENNVNLSSLANTGFTFEYYGKLKAGNAYHHITGQVYDYVNGGILSTYDTLNGNKIWNQYSNIRTKIDKTGKMIFSCGSPYSGISDYSAAKLYQNGSGWYQNNQYYSIPNYNVNDVYFIQIMFNPNIKYTVNDIEYISQIVLINGEELYNGKFAKSTWDSFIQENSGEFLWEIGRMNGADYGGLNAYANLETRAMRLYNKAITADEAKLNYNATVAYYDYITNDSTTSTGGNTGGEDIDTIE